LAGLGGSVVGKVAGRAIKSGIKNSTKTVAKTTKGNIFKKETIQAPSGFIWRFYCLLFACFWIFYIKTATFSLYNWIVV
jgi:hypothetical protein